MRNHSAWFWGLLAVLMLMCLSVPSAASAADDSTPNSYAPGEVLVKLVPGVDVRAVAADNGMRPTPKDQFKDHPIYRMQIIDGTSPPGKSAHLAADPRIIYAEPNYEGQIPEARQHSSWAVGGDAGAYVEQWASDKIRLPEAHAVTHGEPITVAVLDTGADLDHPALAGRIAAGFDFVDDDADPSEVGEYGHDHSYGHGTHVAGLIALVAPEAKIMPLRTLTPEGNGTLWAQVEALRYALDHDADVINLSFSFGTPSKLLDDVLAEATCTAADDGDCRLSMRPGAVVVAAAGNHGTALQEYPAATLVPGVVAVTASTQADALATFSTYGVWVEVAAPGEQILSSVPGGGYASWSGTSMATALVAGTAALVRSAYPKMRPPTVAMHITTTASHVSGPVQRRVDAAAALRLGAPILP